MGQYRHGVHWLAFVVHGPKDKAFMLYDLFLRGSFGELQSMGNGGRGFKEIYSSLLGFKVYVDPSRGTEEYFHFEIPGLACELISWELFQGLDDVLRNTFSGRYHYSRLDYAFDDLPFTPMQVEAAIRDGDVRSLAKRKTLKVAQSAFEPKESGEVGTHTTYFGSRQSERMIRVYDKRGYTRLELEMKGKRSDLVAKQLFGATDFDAWFPLAVGHLRDFVEFKTKWWNEFTQGTGRAQAIVTTPKEASEAVLTKWMTHQVAASLSVMDDLHPEHFIRDLLATGKTKRKRSKRLQLLLSGKRQAREGGENESNSVA